MCQHCVGSCTNIGKYAANEIIAAEFENIQKEHWNKLWRVKKSQKYMNIVYKILYKNIIK